MTQTDFVQEIETALHEQTGRAFNRPWLIAFVEDAWPPIEDDPDVQGWAEVFLDAHAPAIAE